MEALPVGQENKDEEIAKSIVPYNRDDARCRYLGLRASGFGIREALRLIGKAQSTLSLWRHQQLFVDLENRIPELRKELALEYANLEFLRNYRLILEKDYRVIKESLEKRKDKEGNILPMLNQDHQYLLKMRSHYNPQQLQIMEALFMMDKSGEGFDFTDLIMTMSRTKDEVKLESRKHSKPELSTIVEAE